MSKFHHVLCTLPHASTTINGVPFARHALGMLSVDPVEGDHMKVFSAIAGFRLVSAEGLTEDETKAIDGQKAAEAADLAAAAAVAAASAKAAPTAGTPQAVVPPVDGEGQSGAGAEDTTGKEGGIGTEGSGTDGSGTEGGVEGGSEGGREGGEQSSNTPPVDKASGTDKPAAPAKAASKKKATAANS